MSKILEPTEHTERHRKIKEDYNKKLLCHSCFVAEPLRRVAFCVSYDVGICKTCWYIFSGKWYNMK